MPVGIAPVQQQKKKSFIDAAGDIAGGIKDVAAFANDADSFISKFGGSDTSGHLQATNTQTVTDQIEKTPPQPEAIARRFKQIGLAPQERLYA